MTWFELMTETGLPIMICLLMLLAAFALLGWALNHTGPVDPEPEDMTCQPGPAATRNASPDSRSPSTVTPATYACSEERPQPTTLSPALTAAVTRSRTYGQHTNDATADAGNVRSNGSDAATIPSYSTPNSQLPDGTFSALDRLETARRSERFFSTKQNGGDE